MPPLLFGDQHINRADWMTEKPYWFEAAMVSTCAPLFDGCEDNHAVEKELRRAHVIRHGCDTDTESCALVVYFKTMDVARGFLSRLNAYLVKKAERMGVQLNT